MEQVEIGGQYFDIPSGLDNDTKNEVIRNIYLTEQKKKEAASSLPEVSQPQIVPQKDTRRVRGGQYDDIQELPPKEVPEGDYQAFGEVRQDIDPSSLNDDVDWLDASRLIYRLNEGRDYSGDPEDLAEYGLNFMGWFNYNLPAMAYKTNQISGNNASQIEKEAFLHLMDTYDNLNVSWSGVGRFFYGMAADPTNLPVIASFGLIGGAKYGAQQVGKQGLKQLLKQGVKTGVVTGIESGMISYADNTMRQLVEVDAGRKDEIDSGERLGATAIGTGVGFIGGAAIDAGVTAIRQSFKSSATNKAAKKAVEKVTTKATEKVTEEGVTTATTKATQEATQEVTEEAIPTSLAKELTDDVPTSNTNEFVEIVTFDQLKMKGKESNILYQTQTFKENIDNSMALAEQFSELNHESIDGIIKNLKIAEMTMADYQEFSLSVNMAQDWSARDLRALMQEVDATIAKGVSGDKLDVLMEKRASQYKRYLSLQSMNEAIGSNEGATLGRRRITDNFGDPMQDAKAYDDAVVQAEKSKEVRQVVKAYEEKIEVALAAGDMAKAIELTAMKKMESRGLVDAAVNGRSTDGIINRNIRKANEAAISNVFSPTTLVINALAPAAKVIYKPLLDAVVTDPFDRITRKKLMATYSAMSSARNSAASAAVAAFKYEQPLLTKDVSKYMEDSIAIKGKYLQHIRAIPKALNASDEGLSQIVYQGFIAGQATEEAYTLALAKGLAGKKEKAFVEKFVKDAIDKSYTNATDLDGLDAIVSKGISLELKGEALQRYVRKEAVKNPEALRSGTNTEGLDYVRDVLYKRKFSGKGVQSKMALRYEEWVNEMPIMRLLGQLFFRTPVRVFQEGIRLTPAIQIVDPTWVMALGGKYGKTAQVRAQGEAMLSIAITTTVFTLYAEGRITGDGADSNWRQTRTRENSDMPSTYTITGEDGGTFHYRNFDPFATPVKIIVNALERYEKLHIKKKQGEMIDASADKKIFAAISVATGAFAKAIADASLMNGLQEVVQLGEMFANPEQKSDVMMKYAANKLKLAVPNTLHKGNKHFDPVHKDTASLWDGIENNLLEPTTLGLYESHAAKTYDQFGRVRKIKNTGLLWNIFSVTTEEERRDGMSDIQLRARRGLDALSKETGVSFDTPFKHERTGEMDLRKFRTMDGKETLYDRWNKNLELLKVDEQLAAIIDSPLSTGTYSTNGIKVGIVTRTLADNREQAFLMLMKEEEVLKRFMKKTVKTIQDKVGLWDINRPR